MSTICTIALIVFIVFLLVVIYFVIAALIVGYGIANYVSNIHPKGNEYIGKDDKEYFV